MVLRGPSRLTVLGILIWINVVLISSGHSCDDRQDVKYVDRCPETSDEWNAAAENKNCAQFEDDCPFTEDRPRVYHCVTVRYQPRYVEVCSKVWISQGQCVDFEPVRNMVTSNFDKNCTTCPKRYKSTDIYKISECYDEHDKEPTNLKPAARPLLTTTTPSHTHHGTYSWEFIIMITTLLFLILAVVLSLLIMQLPCCCKARRVVNRRVEDADTESNEMTELQRY